jgi:SEC-C motif
MNDISLSTPQDNEPFDLEREPLDRPPAFARDWGGDGTDLSRPVRAHVLAALRPNSAPYAPPLDALLRLGDPREPGVAERRAALGLRQEHLPELLRMARDRELYTANGDTDEVWAPLHAFYALTELGGSAGLPELLPLFDLEDDWLDTALPEFLGKLGAPALEPLQGYLADRTRWAYGHSAACRALEQIAQQHPELREQVVATLSDLLRDAEHYPEEATTAAMHTLVELDAVEALPLIRRAFELGKIDEMVRGGWGDVLHDLGMEPEQDDPLVEESRQRFEDRRERFFPRQQREQLQAALARFTGRDNAFAGLTADTPVPRDAQAIKQLLQRTGAPPQAQPATGARRSSKASSYTRAQPKLGRNDPCWCGSGRKYKHCHLDADRSKP